MAVSRTFSTGFIGALGLQALVAKIVLEYGDDAVNVVTVGAGIVASWVLAALQTWARNKAVVEGTMASPITGVKKSAKVE